MVNVTTRTQASILRKRFFFIAFSSFPHCGSVSPFTFNKSVTVLCQVFHNFTTITYIIGYAKTICIARDFPLFVASFTLPPKYCHELHLLLIFVPNTWRKRKQYPVKMLLFFVICICVNLAFILTILVPFRPFLLLSLRFAKGKVELSGLLLSLCMKKHIKRL